MHVDAPAEGIWEDDGDVERDRIVVVEVMTDEIDRHWGSSYRKELEARFQQEEVVVRAMEIERIWAGCGARGTFSPARHSIETGWRN